MCGFRAFPSENKTALIRKLNAIVPSMMRCEAFAYESRRAEIPLVNTDHNDITLRISDLWF